MNPFFFFFFIRSTYSIFVIYIYIYNNELSSEKICFHPFIHCINLTAPNSRLYMLAQEEYLFSTNLKLATLARENIFSAFVLFPSPNFWNAISSVQL